MGESCPWTERVIEAADGHDPEVADHLGVCTECRAELSAHEELLQTFRGQVRPALSPHFNTQLMARVEKERRRQRIVRRRLMVLRLYWLAASVLCAAVFAHLAVSSPAGGPSAPVLLAIALFVVPMAALLIAIRTDPFELILRAMTGTPVSGASDT
jgi:anti-sigma factor RsiW